MSMARSATRRFEFLFLHDGNAVGIERPGQLGRVAASGDVGDLGGGKSHHLVLGIVTEQGVEIVKIAAGCAEDDNALHGFLPLTL